MRTPEQGLILGVETSCDETASALVREDGTVVASLVASQIALHAPYGGVVPELASRNHSADLAPLIRQTMAEAGADWSQVVAIAATSGPGLASSLLVGDTTGKAIAAALGCPFYSVNHLEGHLLSPFMKAATVAGSALPASPDAAPATIPGHLAMVVSGGHTLLVDVAEVGRYTVLGSTRDDAAGEAFDKVGKMLGLPYPGGPQVARLAAQGDPEAYAFPRSMLDRSDWEFSFSGMKTAAATLLSRLGAADRSALPESVVADICASFQEAMVDILATKLLAAADAKGRRFLTLSGGVACNLRLRERISLECESRGLELRMVEGAHATDNAAMVAFAASRRRAAGLPSSPLDQDIDPNRTLAAREVAA